MVTDDLKVKPVLDLLTINNFVVEIERVPVVRYLVQNVTMPDLTLPEVRRGTPFQVIMETGDHIEFSPVTFDFLVDEELLNYRTVFYWMTGLGFHDSYKQFEEFMKGLYTKHGIKKSGSSYESSGAFQFSDVILTITTNHKNPYMKIRFKDCYPTNVGSLALSVSDGDSSPVTATATFQFTGMEIEVLGDN